MAERIALQRVWVPCPVCGCDDAVTVLTIRRAGAHRVYAGERSLEVEGAESLARCRCCGMAYINPQPQLPPHLCGYSRAQEQAYFDATRVERLQGARRLLTQLEQCLGRPGRLLDVGCGDGALLTVALERGWRAEGVEASAALLEQMQTGALAGRVRLGRAEALESCDRQYDAVVLLNVLEHVREPRVALGEAARVLLPGGIVAVHVPNYAWGRLFGRRWHQLLPLEHLHYFTPATLALLLGQMGLQPVGRFALLAGERHKALLQRALGAVRIWPGSGLGLLAIKREPV